MPEQPTRSVAVEIAFDTVKQIITFTEKESNGIALIDPPKVSVPFPFVMAAAAEIILMQTGRLLDPNAMAMVQPVKDIPQDRSKDNSLSFEQKIGKKS